MTLTGKKALVTGGSRGIGGAIVDSLLREGAQVVSISRTAGERFEEYQRIAREAGGAFAHKSCDIADTEAFEAVIASVLEETGGLDVLVNNAGITKDGLIFRMAIADWNDVLRTNLTSTFVACKAVAYSMARRRAGSIINISSIVGIVGNAGQTNYAASKAGVIGFSKSLAREVAGRGVRVNVIAPGYIETAMTDRLNEKQKEALVAQIPLGRVGLAKEVAQSAVFLASDASAYITGQVLQVDGGLAM